MKNFYKWFGIITLTVIIGFSLASCKQNPDTPSGGGLVGTIVSGATVEYSSANITNMTEAKSYTDFSYFWGDPLSIYINAPTSVTISGGKLTIKLGIPKDEYFQDCSSLIEGGITVTPSNAKVFTLLCDDDGYITSDEKYGLACLKDQETLDDDEMAGFIYADRDVTIKGTETNGDGTTYNVSLKKGWNYWIIADSYSTITSSLSQPNGYKWVVYDGYRHY
jgi:hypothetical protein